MAKISLRGLYAVAAMYALSKKYNDETPTKIKNIAKLSNTPQNFLEQILNDLKKKGLVKSIRGAKGGYMLSKHPTKITVYDIISCVEGELFQVECKTKNLTLKLFWMDFYSKLKEFLSIKLSDLKQYEDKAIDQNMFYI